MLRFFPLSLLRTQFPPFNCFSNALFHPNLYQYDHLCIISAARTLSRRIFSGFPVLTPETLSTCSTVISVNSQIFVRYPFSYFWLETGSCQLIFVILRAPQIRITLKFQWPRSKKKFFTVLFFKSTKGASKQNKRWNSMASKQKEIFLQYFFSKVRKAPQNRITLKFNGLEAKRNFFTVLFFKSTKGASKQNNVEIQWPRSKKKFLYSTFFQKYESTKINTGRKFVTFKYSIHIHIEWSKVGSKKAP